MSTQGGTVRVGCLALLLYSLDSTGSSVLEFEVFAVLAKARSFHSLHSMLGI